MFDFFPPSLCFAHRQKFLSTMVKAAGFQGCGYWSYQIFLHLLIPLIESVKARQSRYINWSIYVIITRGITMCGTLKSGSTYNSTSNNSRLRSHSNFCFFCCGIIKFVWNKILSTISFWIFLSCIWTAHAWNFVFSILFTFNFINLSFKSYIIDGGFWKGHPCNPVDVKERWRLWSMDVFLESQEIFSLMLVCKYNSELTRKYQKFLWSQKTAWTMFRWAIA